MDDSKTKNNKINSLKDLVITALNNHKEGNIKLAESLYKEVIAAGALNSQVLSNYGLICSNTGRINEAIELYKKSIEYFPTNSEAYFYLALIMNEKGKAEHAEELLLKAIDLKPDYLDALYNLSKLYQEAGKNELAYQNANKVITMNPNFDKAYVVIGNIYKENGDYKKARDAFLKAIKLNDTSAATYLNIGSVYKELRDIKEAEKNTKKAIKLKKNYSDAHYNLAGILIQSGNLEEAKNHLQKAITYQKNRFDAYFILSTLKDTPEKNILTEELMNTNPEQLKIIKQKINYYFTLANVMHRKKEYKKASIYLDKANNTKLKCYPSEAKEVIKTSIFCYELSKKLIPIKENLSKSSQRIFIVGMPRSGSTLLESILGMNEDVYNLGETGIMQRAANKWAKRKQKKEDANLEEIYEHEILEISLTTQKITTDKQLFNYAYTGLILNKIPSSLIINCTRNPLDNILSIYKANFSKGHKYSSSLNDCADIYLNKENLMNQYKKKYKSKIYDFNYDAVVLNPEKEIKKLIDWLGYKWENFYLTPHLTKRQISTASKVQARYPINRNSFEGWKNYKDLLKPVINKLGL